MVVAPSGRVCSLGIVVLLVIVALMVIGVLLFTVVARPVTAFQLSDATLCNLDAFRTISPQLEKISSRYESQVFAALIEIQRALKCQPCSDQRLLFEIIPSCDAVSVERVLYRV